MKRGGWHMLREKGALTMARQLPVRFDLCASAAFPPASKGRLALQIRQDLWRMLQDLRGFSPVVTVEEEGQGLRVRAGGRAAAPFPRSDCERKIAALLTSPSHRARWLAQAGSEPRT
ncbi:hypothetical protein [Rhodovulum sulfidophilum]|uniref:Uncharacterized protein n=2 Tax=Rhodovulum sulfidophilum TaxID=35806 RepID=A0ABS1RQ76_RHOSU|nr:hypothetical protein [Rhodovulum sulfidophilum]ANB35008.1 hypothetical protein A6W98_13590 [Rhodovulum sulfidophilum DSM 1374]ANB38830.1 hypothetical protein A6024_13455 [Rhodovulum sulfidophilum]MBL3559778.1 hypothetical protein [Rhodovulum sulfidophilum]MBL3563474.1 hypothetical protein [Rhodovulum sulfidophilum]MBL3572466.1 hypothetical protein [Rhodovulum sulfidophilum]